MSNEAPAHFVRDPHLDSLDVIIVKGPSKNVCDFKPVSNE